MIRTFTREFIYEINSFLSNDIWPSRWVNAYKIERKSIDDETYDVVKRWVNYDQERSTEEVIVFGLSLIPALETSISLNRDFSLSTLLKYHNFACDFNNFRIDRLNLNKLNDKKEGAWFGEFVENNLSRKLDTRKIVESFLKKYSILSTYTTTTLRNHRYMTSNYSRVGKQAIAFSGDEIVKNYDSMYSGKIKPIRGFVRYGDYEKYLVLFFTSFLGVKYPTAKGLILLIFSLFVKGICMSEEAEYRFLVLSTNNLAAIEIESMVKTCYKFTCSLHSENCYYSKNSPCECRKKYEESLRCGKTF